MDADQVRKIAEWYDKLSSSYDELYGEEQALKHKIILDYFGTKRMTTLLDVGCGTGTFLERADPLYSLGIGVDISKQMLMIAKRKRSSKTDFVQASSSRMPIKNRVVDCTVSVSTATADQTVSGFIMEIDRIGSENSILAMTLFEESINCESLLKERVQFSRKINQRERLYVFGLNQAGSKR